MSSHSRLSPSSSERWLRCPGSVGLLEALGNPDSSSDAADEGTYLHAVTSDLLALELDDASMLLGRKSACGRFELDAATVEHVQTCVDIARDLTSASSVVAYETRYDVNMPWIVEAFEALGTKHAAKVAKRLLDKPKLANELRRATGGTADVVALLTRENAGEAMTTQIDVVDFKFGSGVYVDVNNNAQLRTYALLACSQSCYSDTLDVVVRIHVVQPRHYRAETDGALRTETLTLGELLTWAVSTYDIALDILEGLADDVFATGEHCRFCGGKAACPALREEALETARVVFSDVDKFETNKKHKPPVVSLNDAAIGRLLSAFDAVETWIAAVREEAYARAQRNVYLPGWKLVEKYGHRKWADEAVVRALCVSRGVDPFEEPKPRKLKSPAQLEKKLGKAAVSSLAVKPVTGTVLVPETDARPPYKATSVFSPIDDQKKEQEQEQ